MFGDQSIADFPDTMCFHFTGILARGHNSIIVYLVSYICHFLSACIINSDHQNEVGQGQLPFLSTHD